MSGCSSVRKRSRMGRRARTLLMFQDATERVDMDGAVRSCAASRNKTAEKGRRSGGGSGGQTKRLNARSIARLARATGGKTRSETAIASFVLGLSTCRPDEWIVKLYPRERSSNPRQRLLGQ